GVTKATGGEPVTADAVPRAETAGTVIAGRYKLLQQIGEGGMGTVWMAEQTEPVRRRVAVKLIRVERGLSKTILSRFEAERQAIALMDHPHIARLLDAGTADSGAPFFVMELVKGVPLTNYCDEQRLTPLPRLELFVPVCQAIQHAHQKGIIHRDIKPSNVLAALYDGRPVPKVIDFGVAKATIQPLTDKTLVTSFGAVLGTLEYMSPEQAELNQLDIDTRSDVYSLGVLLYELLTGTTPLERKRLKDTGLLEALRLIREEEPPRPSTRLSTTEQLPSIAVHRGVEPSKLSGLMRGELDWIVMKALEKDRNRRYQSANDLVLDLQRYLNDEPVLACPPTAAYRLGKLVRRNKRLLTAVVAVAASLLVGLAVAVVLLVTHAIEMQEEQKKTTAALGQAQGNLERADQNLELALQALDEVYVRDRKERIRQDKRLAEAQRETLQKGFKFYERFAKQNAGHEELQRATAKAYRRAGNLRRNLKDWAGAQADFAQAIAILEKWADESHGSREDQEELARCYYGMTHSLQKAGQHSKAAPFCRRAIALFEKLAADRQDPYDRFELGQSLGQMGVILSSAGQPEKAEEAMRQSLRLFEGLMAEYPTEPFSRPKAGATDREEGDTLRIVLPLHTEYAEQLCYTARLLSFLLPEDRMQEKLALFRKAADVYGKLFAAHPQVSDFLQDEADTHHHIGDVLATLKRYEEAEKAYRKAVDLFQKLRGGKFGPGMSRDIKSGGSAYTALANFLMARNRSEDAVTVLRQASALYGKFPNDPHSQSAWARSHFDLAELLLTLGQKEEAAKAFREVIAICEKLAADSPTKLTEYADFVGHSARRLSLMLSGDRIQERLALVQKAAEIYGKLTAAHSDSTYFLHFEADTHRLLGDVLSTLKRYEEAEKAYRQAVDLFQKLPGGKFVPGGYRNITEEVAAYSGLANLLMARNRSEDAATVLRQAIALYEKFPNDPHSQLALVLVRDQFHRRFGQWDKAIAEYSKDIERNPKRSEPWSSRGFAHLSLRQWDKSIQDYTKAIELAPNVRANWWHRGRAYLELGQWDKVVANYSKLLEKYPNDSNALYFRAVGYVNLNQPERAVADLRQAIAKGYRNLQGMKNDGRFASLRTREDFKKLLAEAEPKAQEK
ncbi:MAG TPA: serine/threonine-protein kinase, partial [Gemmataceae bacterium]